MVRAEVLSILETGDFDQLVGVREDLQIEFKGQPYRVDQESQKFELAKDCCSLANAQGGIIVIGVRAERIEQSLLEEAVEIRPFARSLVDTRRYVDLVLERVYPRLQGVRIEFASRADETDRGVVFIDIPPQNHADELFMVQRVVDEGGAAPTWLVAIPVRSIARTDESRVSEIHGLIKRGYAIADQLSEMRAEISGIAEALRADGGAPYEPHGQLTCSRNASTNALLT